MKTINYSKWGRMGRLGNQMWELASLYGMAEKYNRKVILPQPWKYQKYFGWQVDVGEPITMNSDVNEPSYEFPGWEYWDEKEENAGEQFRISGWLQSSKYFSKEIAKKIFNFKEDIREKIDTEWKGVFEKPVIMIGIRVGKDYVDNGNYVILNPLYQMSALVEVFPNWREQYNILVFSDNYQYAKLHFNASENIYFAEGLSDIEQMYLGTKCQHFILPNSTFSWWQAYLGEKEDSVVIHPSEYFQGYLATTHSTRDFWEPHWLSHYYKGNKLDLMDVTFTIPVKYDHRDRRENLELILGWINNSFKTRVCLGEQGGSSFYRLDGWTQYLNFAFPSFHRTKMLNDMAKASITPLVVNFDCDNFCSPLQMWIAIDMLRKNECDCVYPYDGRVARVNRESWYGRLLKEGVDCGIFGGEIFKGTRDIDPKSVGHIIAWNKEKFLEGGGENENFISYGPEDVERWERFTKLGYRIARVNGIVYHLDHWVGPDSGGKNPNFGDNYVELERIRGMNKERLLIEVSKWE